MENHDPLVSVVIPVFNGEKYLRETIETVLEQDYKPIEILVIDDGSTDQSASIARSFSEVHYSHHENQGNARARNKGVQLARGEWIALLDQDDLWAKQKIRRHVEFHLKYPELQYTISHFKMFLSPGMERPKWCREELLTQGHADFSPSSLVCRKDLFRIVGTFDPALKSSSDADWFFRAKDLKVPMTVIPEILVYRRVHKANQSMHVRQTHSELLKIIHHSIQRKRVSK